VSAALPIDAVRSPIGHAGPGPSSVRLERLGAEFTVLLGADRIFVRHQGGEHFISPRPDDTLLFPRTDARSGQSRYRWEARGDGVFYGYLESGG
jgi:hypothetical protein